jgi:hypothetical protein
MYEIDKDLLKQILKKYGEEEQLLQTMGECGELIAKAQNYLRAKKFKRRQETFSDVLGEAVDVFFMIQQIRAMNPEMFDYICSQKVVGVYMKFENENP